MRTYDEIVRSPCRVEVQTPDVVFYPQESQAAACLHMDRLQHNPQHISCYLHVPYSDRSLGASGSSDGHGESEAGTRDLTKHPSLDGYTLQLELQTKVIRRYAKISQTWRRPLLVESAYKYIHI